MDDQNTISLCSLKNNMKNKMNLGKKGKETRFKVTELCLCWEIVNETFQGGSGTPRSRMLGRRTPNDKQEYTKHELYVPVLPEPIKSAK